MNTMSKTIPFALSIGLLPACAAPAQPAGPAIEFKDQYTSTSPGGTTTVELGVNWPDNRNLLIWCGVRSSRTASITN